MSASGLAKLVEELAKGERALDEILASLRPPEERTALMRCAVVSGFDRALAESVLLTANSPSFDELVALADVEAVPRHNGVFRLLPSARSGHWGRWWPADGSIAPTELPPDLRTLLDRLVEYHEEHNQPLDLLAQRSLVDQDGAAKLFVDLYRRADEAFNLPACQDLIDVLSDPDRISLLPRRLRELRADRMAYLRARGLWSTEYFHTAHFLEPAGVVATYRELLDSGGSRVLNLHAPGGRGKTMQLRWLIARRLVPESALGGLAGGRIPCANVDFDFIDPVNATRYPWLVLLEVAAQLNDQLPSPPFSALLEENGWATPLLRRNPADPSRAEAASRRVQSQGDRVGARVVGKFGRMLAEHVGDAPVVLVFDTLEEIHLRPQGDLQAVLELVGALLDQVPGLRFVLAGRHPIREILGSAAPGLPIMTELEILPFADTEADHYLSVLRGVQKPSTRQAIVAKADGDPFLLSMLADVVQERPGLSPAEIRRYPADLIFLIRKIVKRIHEPGVRWLLRYGVVPRRLTLSFVRDVMQPYLRDAMSGRLAHDAPAEDELPAELGETEPSFPTDLLDTPEGQLSLENLWADLRRYASSTSWVSEIAGADDTLRFRAEVVVPMRRVIRRRQVYRRLHEAAVRHFEAKAAAEPGLSEVWMREAIYHRFQLEGAAAVPFWRAALDAQRDAPERREAIAAELLEPDYIDEDGNPHPWDDDQPFVDRATIVEARFERCLALVELARQRNVPPDDVLWNQAEKGLATAREAERAIGRKVLSRAALAYVRGALALKVGRVKEAEAVVREALPTARNAADRVRLDLLLGDAQHARGDRTASNTYRGALRVSHTPTQEASIRRRIVVAEADMDSLRKAYREYEKGLTAATSGRERAELQVLGAEIELRCGYLVRAEETAREAVEEAGSTAWRLRIASAIARHEVQRASDLATEAETFAGMPTASGSLKASSEAAGARECVGLAASELMDYGEASAALEAARSLWRSQGALEAVTRCSLASAVLELRQVGDLKVTEQHLSEAEALELVTGSDAWLETRLLRAQVLGRKGAGADGANKVHETLAELRATEAPPRRLIRAAVAALAHGDPDQHILVLDLLAEQSALITPVSARLVALSGMSEVDELPGDGCATRLGRLRELLTMPRDTRLTELDRAVLWMTVAELERLSGAPEAARSRLERARTALSHGPSVYWLRPWSLALDRAGHGSRDRPSRAEIEKFLEHFGSHSLLCAAFLIERAEATMSPGGATAPELLEEASRFLARVPGKETQWHMRLQDAQGTIAEHAHGPEAAKQFATAAAIALRLGLTLPVLGARPISGPDPLAELARGRAGIRLSRAAAGMIDVDVTLPARSGAIAEHGQAPYPFSAPSQHPYALATELAEWWIRDEREGARRLGSLLLPQKALVALRSAADAPIDLRLQIEDRELRSVPWELARTPDHDVLLVAEPAVAGVVRLDEDAAAGRNETTFVQTALNSAMKAGLVIDGEFGPRTKDALSRYQRSLGLPADGILRGDDLDRLQNELAGGRSRGAGSAPPVVLVQPSTERQVYAGRGKASEGVDLEGLYGYVGFRVLRLETPSVRDVRMAMEQAIAEDDVPAILHFSGGLRELPHGIALTFLAGEWSQEALSGDRSIDEFSITALDFILEAFPRDVFRPLVILDIDSPHGLTETVSQLLLRNAFAADLFGLGHCRAIIATGLLGDGGSAVYDALVKSLGHGASILETSARLQRMQTAGPDDLGSTATALFTHLPWLRPWPR